MLKPGGELTAVPIRIYFCNVSSCFSGERSDVHMTTLCTLPHSFLEAFNQPPVLLSEGLADRDVNGLPKSETKLLNILAATKTSLDLYRIHLFGVVR